MLTLDSRVARPARSSMRQVDRAARACWSPPTRISPTCRLRRPLSCDALVLEPFWPCLTLRTIHQSFSTATRLFHRPPQSSSPTPGSVRTPCPDTPVRHPIARHRLARTAYRRFPGCSACAGCCRPSLDTAPPLCIEYRSRSLRAHREAGLTPGEVREEGMPKEPRGLAAGALHTRAVGRAGRRSRGSLKFLSFGGICRSSGGSVDGWRGVG